VTWHYEIDSDAIRGPSAKELRQKPRRNCRRLVRHQAHQFASVQMGYNLAL
jgi:hypothetical protein